MPSNFFVCLFPFFLLFFQIPNLCRYSSFYHFGNFNITWSPASPEILGVFTDSSKGKNGRTKLLELRKTETKLLKYSPDVWQKSEGHFIPDYITVHFTAYSIPLKDHVLMTSPIFKTQIKLCILSLQFYQFSGSGHE